MVLLLLFGVDSFMYTCMPVLLTRLCVCVVMLKIIRTITNVPFKSFLCIHAFKHDRVHIHTLNQSQTVSVTVYQYMKIIHTLLKYYTATPSPTGIQVHYFKVMVMPEQFRGKWYFLVKY